MALPATFDPLIDFDGVWTTGLAERYLPLPELPDARYECIDGRLVVSPTEVNSNSYGAIELLKLVDGAHESIAGGVGGQMFEAAEPFEVQFNPRDLVP